MAYVALITYHPVKKQWSCLTHFRKGSVDCLHVLLAVYITNPHHRSSASWHVSWSERTATKEWVSTLNGPSMVPNPTATVPLNRGNVLHHGWRVYFNFIWSFHIYVLVHYTMQNLKDGCNRWSKIEHIQYNWILKKLVYNKIIYNE